MTTILEITAGESCCTIAPALGGGLTGWSVGRQPLLLSAGAGEVASGNRLALASFPLVPYSNRIDSGRFRFAGESVELAPNFLPEPHTIHGSGWEDAWTVSNRSSDAVTLDLHHPGDARWPWPFAARQVISVTSDKLVLRLSATNLALTAVPLAFGHHPYFASAGAHLQFKAAQIWLSGADQLPIGPAPIGAAFDFSTGAAVAERRVDHCFSGWDGHARIVWTDRPLALEIASNLPCAVVYIPADADRFCFEPVPHSNNALNRTDALPPVPLVAPGECFAARLEFSAVPK